MAGKTNSIMSNTIYSAGAGDSESSSEVDELKELEMRTGLVKSKPVKKSKVPTIKKK